LAEISIATGLPQDEVVSLHSGPIYRVRFMGFAPGFPYLDGLDKRLRLPRRANPRQRMQAGAVAIAHRYASVYPSASPGGWHWLGNTEFPLIHQDLNHDGFVLNVGDLVRFIPE
jgi:KipI family sensor histidine kinase inhibitor